MAKKKIEPVLQIAGTIQNAMEIISRRITILGGNYTEALVRIGMGEKQYSPEVDQLAAIYASVSNGFVAPDAGRIHVLHRVMVDESVDWNMAIDASCPDTPANYEVRKVGESYPAKVGSGVKPISRSVVLVNFGKDFPNTDPALAWSKGNKLSIASPRTVFAVVGKHPTLHKELGVDPMAIISLEECNFSGHRHVPYAWLYGGKRRARLYWSGSSFDGHCWFAFVRE